MILKSINPAFCSHINLEHVSAFHAANTIRNAHNHGSENIQCVRLHSLTSGVQTNQPEKYDGRQTKILRFQITRCRHIDGNIVFSLRLGALHK